MITVLVILAILSVILTAWRWLVSLVFPLHQPLGAARTFPAVTVVKPLKGVENETYRCLRSWLELKYPGSLQILFGVASDKDPVCDIVRKLLAELPHVNARLVICPEVLGPNRKVSTLMQLERLIKSPLVFISDADVFVPPDFLGKMIPYFESADTGLVNCFYRYANANTWAMHWEAVGVNADFWSQVLQAKSLKDADFALGAVMAMPLKRLQDIGGFASLVHFLADDYHLGRRVARSGGRIVFAQVTVDCFEAQRSWRMAWEHQVRWARTIRVCQPMPYFFSILNNATFWPFLMLLVGLFGGAQAMCHTILPLFGAAIVFRMGTAFHLQCRLLRRSPGLHGLYMAPIKDLLDVMIWALSFLGNTIEWRGDHYHILKDGQLEKMD